MKTLELKQDEFGQWLYRSNGYDWQYGTYEKDSTVAQAEARFGKFDQTRSVRDTSPECHICGCYTEQKCVFDQEMNPYSNPQACCGCADCAGDV